MTDDWTAALKRVDPPEPEPLAVPRILTAEHPVEVASLPRGPKIMANVVDQDTWETWWTRAETERLSDPLRGGESFGLAFAHRMDGRYGWAVWIAGSFEAAFLWTSRRAVVPRQLSAKELKALLAE